MKPDIDLIVKDILAEDPELGLEADSLRALVVELAEKQPAVTVDATFRNELRTKLLYELHAQKHKRAKLPWWLIYTVPVGVTAILLLVVQPSPTTIPPAPTSTDSYDVAPAMLEMDSPASKRSVEMADPAMSAGMAEDSAMYAAPTATNDFFTAAFSENRATVRIAYVSISASAFIRISGPQGDVLVSDLLLPGEQTDLELRLNTPVTRGTTYTATLHYDNGDGVFDAQTDVSALDAAGMPISMTLVP